MLLASGSVCGKDLFDHSQGCLLLLVRIMVGSSENEVDAEAGLQVYGPVLELKSKLSGSSLSKLSGPSSGQSSSLAR
ncbi:hypothetical protein HS088_TW01G00793 [Tripterygium wilfordii]|uniref:Uncharacterized protein n=1 Tax=Tripterygium wilfordii TaxID=458696 RepID=A0A7J7E2Q0_TRIWF|nr:hypothetical protein HS088_TW01G00793 [Tripterygium wilfordii]